MKYSEEFLKLYESLKKEDTKYSDFYFSFFEEAVNKISTISPPPEGDNYDLLGLLASDKKYDSIWRIMSQYNVFSSVKEFLHFCFVAQEACYWITFYNTKSTSKIKSEMKKVNNYAEKILDYLFNADKLDLKKIDVVQIYSKRMNLNNLVDELEMFIKINQHMYKKTTKSNKLHKIDIPHKIHKKTFKQMYVYGELYQYSKTRMKKIIDSDVLSEFVNKIYNSEISKDTFRLKS